MKFMPPITLTTDDENIPWNAELFNPFREKMWKRHGVYEIVRNDLRVFLIMNTLETANQDTVVITS
jgi:hypothetical protein